MKIRNWFLAITAVVIAGLLNVYQARGADAVRTPAKGEVAQKVQKLQMPFIANEGQTDEGVKFYANTFGGTVFVTKEGEIVYSLPKHEDTAKEGRKDRKCEDSSDGGNERCDLTKGGRKAGEHGDVSSCLYNTENIVSVQNLQTGLLSHVGWIRQSESTKNNKNMEITEDTKNIKTTEKLVATENTENLSFAANAAIPNAGRSGASPKSADSVIARNEVSKQSSHENPQSSGGVVLKERLIGGKVSGIKGEQEAVTKVSYFKGNDASKWKSGISTYEMVDLGDVYDGIGLKLKAYGKNVEKLFCVKPGADPNKIEIALSGLKHVNTSERQPPESPFIKGDFTKSPVEKGNLTKSPLEKGARGLWVNKEGQLVAETELGPVTFTKPIAYQVIGGKRVEVECGYVIRDREEKDTPLSPQAGSGLQPEPLSLLNTDVRVVDTISKSINNEVQVENLNPLVLSLQQAISNSPRETDTPSPIYGFKVAAYDKTKELIIDPLLASTFLGGVGGDIGYSIAIDSGGNIYVTGYTYSADFPTTAGAYDTTYNEGGYVYGDVFVSRFNSGLTSLLASTFLGGSFYDFGTSIVIDGEGNVYVTGYTNSADLPTTGGAYNWIYNGNWDVFVSRFNSGLTTLLASTYLGGPDLDKGTSIAVNSGGNVYVTGHTNSADFPPTGGAYDTTHNGNIDVFVSRFNSGLTSLLASTFLGGSETDGGASIAIDSEGNVYVTGYTGSNDFPTTVGAYDMTYNGGYNDVFVSRFNSDLTSLLTSTFLGGSETDGGASIAIDSGGNVYVTGYTNSADFPPTGGAYDTTHNGNIDVFVSRFNSGLTSLLASTFLGGSNRDFGSSIAIDSRGNVYVAGITNNAVNDFPASAGAYDTTHNGNWDVFVSRFNSGLTSLLASTFLGGYDEDLGSSIVIDNGGNVYVTGYTYSTALYNYSPAFPTTGGAYDTTHNGGRDAFVSRFDRNLSKNTWNIASFGGSNYEGQFSSLVFKANGAVNISYYDLTNRDLRLASYQSGTSTTKTTLASVSSIGMYTSAAVGKLNDKLYISYYDQTNGDIRLFTDDVATGMSTTVNVDSSGNTGLYTSTAVDSTGRVYISYYDYTDGDLRLASSSTPGTSTGWTKETIDSLGNVGLHTSIAIDSADRVHISYYDRTKGNLKYATNASGMWTTEVVHGGSNDVGKFSSIAVDSLDNVHISYYNATNGNLMYANNVSGSWDYESVDSGGTVGWYTSLALDTFDNVHISYYDITNRDLKYANNGNSGNWTRIRVDSAGRVGEFTSLKVDGGGFVNISYYDRSNGDLKYAKSITPYGIANTHPSFSRRRR